MEKKLFVETINALQAQRVRDEKCNRAFNVILSSDFITGYDYSLVRNQLIKLLQVEMSDYHRDSWIEYFIHELDFGKKYKKGTATRKDGSEINLSSASALYEFLASEMKLKSESK